MIPETELGGEPIWEAVKFKSFTKMEIWDLQKISALAPNVSIKDVEEILAKRAWDISKSILEGVAGFLPGMLPPHSDLPFYEKELDELFLDEENNEDSQETGTDVGEFGEEVGPTASYEQASDLQ